MSLERWEKATWGMDWKEELRRPMGKDELESIRLSTYRGRPLVAEHLRLGTWDLLCAWTGQPGQRGEPGV